MPYLNNPVVSNANLITTPWDIGWAWLDFTPTLSGLFTDANWTTKSGKYTKIGKTIIAQYKLVAWSSPVSGTSAPSITLPVTAKALLWTSNLMQIGKAVSLIWGVIYTWDVWLTDTTTAILRTNSATWTYTSLVTTYSTIIPWAWASGNEVDIQIVYESA